MILPRYMSSLHFKDMATRVLAGEATNKGGTKEAIKVGIKGEIMAAGAGAATGAMIEAPAEVRL